MNLFSLSFCEFFFTTTEHLEKITLFLKKVVALSSVIHEIFKLTRHLAVLTIGSVQLYAQKQPLKYKQIYRMFIYKKYIHVSCYRWLEIRRKDNIYLDTDFLKPGS